MQHGRTAVSGRPEDCSIAMSVSGTPIIFDVFLHQMNWTVRPEQFLYLLA